MDRLLLIAMELNDYETKRRNLYEAVDEKIYFNKSVIFLKHFFIFSPLYKKSTYE